MTRLSIIPKRFKKEYGLPPSNFSKDQQTALDAFDAAVIAVDALHEPTRKGLPQKRPGIDRCIKAYKELIRSANIIVVQKIFNALTSREVKLINTAEQYLNRH